MSSGRKSNCAAGKWERIGRVHAIALRANCSSHMAAWPSKVTSRVNPKMAAAVSKKSPHRGCGKGSDILANQFQCVPVARGKTKRARDEIRDACRVEREIPPPPAPDTLPRHRLRRVSPVADGQPVRKPSSRLPTKISPPQMAPSSPYPVPSKLTPATRFVHSLRSASTEATCARWCCTECTSPAGSVAA